MVEKDKFKWVFKARFRRGAFGWRSQPAIQRIKEAVSEIKKVARKDSALAGEGAVVFFERLSPAIEQIDGSSGVIGNAAYSAIVELVPVISAAVVDHKIRAKWLERLWEACQSDGMCYLDQLPDYWGDLCASKEIASQWADNFIDTVRHAFDPEARGYFKGTSACLSALYKAERYDELLELLEADKLRFWSYQKFAVKTLAAIGKIDEAIQYANEFRGTVNTSDVAVSSLCEEILLANGRAEEAYHYYAIAANQQMSKLSTYRAIAKKYPRRPPVAILNDLIECSPEEEIGKWFATAKELKLFEKALQLANASPCDPRTLTRAARDYIDSNPDFALGAGECALRWLIGGYGYEITGLDIWAAYDNTIKAAEKLGLKEKVKQNLRNVLLSRENQHSPIAQILKRELSLDMSGPGNPVSIQRFPLAPG